MLSFKLNQRRPGPSQRFAFRSGPASVSFLLTSAGMLTVDLEHRIQGMLGGCARQADGTIRLKTHFCTLWCGPRSLDRGPIPARSRPMLGKRGFPACCVLVSMLAPTVSSCGATRQRHTLCPRTHPGILWRVQVLVARSQPRHLSHTSASTELDLNRRLFDD
jgi:hypothetical protein